MARQFVAAVQQTPRRRRLQAGNFSIESSETPHPRTPGTLTGGQSAPEGAICYISVRGYSKIYKIPGNIEDVWNLVYLRM